MRRYVLVASLSFALSGCDTLAGGVFSRDQSGGVTANSVGTVNQTVAPKVKSPYLNYLQQQWAAGAEIEATMKSGDKTDEEIEHDIQEGNTWAQQTAIWIGTHMTRAAMDKFLRTRGHSDSWIMQTQHPHKFGELEKWSRALNALEDMLDNLDALMRSDEMYPQ